jgi:GNAT superfamily N-acetyltransferase
MFVCPAVADCASIIGGVEQAPLARFDVARVASIEDAPVIASLLHAFNTEFDAETPGQEVLARRLRALLATRQTFAVIAGAPTCSVGLVTLRPNVWTDGVIALLDELYTSPERRGQGIGSAVLATVVQYARQLGATEIEIEVDEPDTDAQRFYSRHGFPLRDPMTGDRAFVLRKTVDAIG